MQELSDYTIMVRDEAEWERARLSLIEHMGASRVLGFDCEWVDVNNWRRLYENSDPGRRRFSHQNCQPLRSEHENQRHNVRLSNTIQDKVSLMQMSVADGFTVLVRLILLKSVPVSLKNLLEDSTILKVGVNIYADCSRMHRDWGVIVNSWLDIRFLVKDSLHNQADEPYRNGLKALGRTFCDDTKHFDQRMRFSNWCDVTLSGDQITYASQDSQIAIGTYGSLGRTALIKSGEFTSSAQKLADEPEIFWMKWNRTCRVYLNSKFDQDKFMSLKMGGQGTGKRKKGRDDVEDSDSDLDLDMSHLAVATMDDEELVELAPADVELAEPGEVAEPCLVAKTAMLAACSTLVNGEEVGHRRHSNRPDQASDSARKVVVGGKTFRIRVTRSTRPITAPTAQ